MRTEQEIDKLIEDMKSRTKGAYLTQGVAFNKNCPRQMEWLKRALMSSASFSGLAKELLAMRFSGNLTSYTPSIDSGGQVSMENKKRNVKNFL